MSEQNIQYDIIGDVHGRWDKLEPLLEKLGYKQRVLGFKHPDGRIPIFLGDLIDPKGDHSNGTREVLECVRKMVKHNLAHCILGNHEYNFVAYHTPDGKGGFLRPHSEKNNRMHAKTHAALEHYPDELEEVWLPWMKKLPFFLDLPELRIVHACWHPEHLKLLDGETLANDNLLRESSIKGTPEYRAVETVLKGVELPMPDGHHFFDHQGIKRTKFRARWWDKELVLPTAKNMLFPAKEEFPDTPLNDADVAALPGYLPAEKPVFIGHYYKPSDSTTEEEAPNLRCLDFSAAIDGPLAAFRWDGEPDLSHEKLVMTKEWSEEELSPEPPDEGPWSLGFIDHGDIPDPNARIYPMRDHLYETYPEAKAAAKAFNEEARADDGMFADLVLVIRVDS